ncbi:MAG: hypothetical protein M1136_08535 [Chloroflexi bacterium]|nr:hypothetical protein [Chloroflexota bacterium]MCL5075671.1 hypothetical protein [Chloroflexota bacterium]
MTNLKLQRPIEWKRTTTQYVAILQTAERFEPGSIREIARDGPETILGGILRGTNKMDWYALAYSRSELDFTEAKELAKRALERRREQTP